MRVGYARVATADQTLDGLRDRLAAVGCGRVCTDVAGVAKAQRDGLNSMLAHLRPGDAVAVVKLDRLTRSLRHLFDVAVDFEARGVDVIALDQQLDTSAPGGRLMFHLLAAMAESERDLIRECTLDGLRAARAGGKGRGGRPAAFTPLQAKQVRWMDAERNASGERVHPVADIARMLGVSRPRIYPALGDHQSGKQQTEGNAAA